MRRIAIIILLNASSVFIVFAWSLQGYADGKSETGLGIHGHND